VEVARTGANPVFLGVLETLRPAAYWAMRQSVSDRRWRSQVALEHEAIAAAISAGDQQQAEELMRAHVHAEMA
jgi:DNA-binding FadR family transcriptional regulator